MNHTLKNRLSKLESNCKVNNPFEHFSDEELVAEIERLDEMTAKKLIEHGPSTDPYCLDLEREIAAIRGQTVEEYRADLISWYHQRHIAKAAV